MDSNPVPATKSLQLGSLVPPSFSVFSLPSCFVKDLPKAGGDAECREWLEWLPESKLAIVAVPIGLPTRSSLRRSHRAETAWHPLRKVRHSRR